MPREEAALATKTPTAPRPITPRLFPLYFPAGKRFFCLFHRFRDIRMLRSVLLHPPDTPGHISGRQQQAAQHQFLHSVGVGPRRIHHYNSPFGTFLQRNIIHPGPGSDNYLKAFRKRQFVHRRAPHQHRVRFFQIFRHFVGIRKQIPSLLGRWGLNT